MSWGDRWVVAQSLVLLPAIALSLALVGLPTTQKYLARLSSRAKATSEMPIVEAMRLARSVNRAADNSPLWGNCLKRSLTLWFLLRRQGVASDLCIGVQLQQSQFKAHAWVKYGGHVINDHPAIHQQFAAFEKPFEPNF
ncbi:MULTISPECIES: lasso peptide biosynthesis B2 protein [Cyanophyceae]|uniref:Lasso peptide biosynthesis B2 protein n=1 Tax=Leptolyngbya subtilissima DQ-A4 TaxID=2933933 RepID=A0ABV0JZ60_9CYAN|nr:lasso peptide biosynthesis B2 protein [Nodosilinea sp. FACHB-141]MBD2112402.1 lasso peptide biosynthesis B2 protein [Nodosilinea sp. FACHB-141]